MQGDAKRRFDDQYDATSRGERPRRETIFLALTPPTARTLPQTSRCHDQWFRRGILTNEGRRADPRWSWAARSCVGQDNAPATVADLGLRGEEPRRSVKTAVLAEFCTTCAGVHPSSQALSSGVNRSPDSRL